jgi:hypothetical protein
MPLPTPTRIKGLLGLMDEALDIDAAYEGVKRLGLKPNNTWKQRAKAMGFNIDAYHGRNNIGEIEDLLKFNPKMSQTDIDAIYAARDPNIAAMFADEGNFGGLLMPLKVRGDYFHFNKPAHLKRLDEAFKKGKNPGYTYNDSWRDGQDMRKFRAGDWPQFENEPFKTLAKKAGFDGINLREFTNYGNTPFAEPRSVAMATEKLKDNLAIFNPANIRSKFAKFNPKYAGIGAGSIMSANLLANEKHEGGLLGENVYIDKLMSENLSRILSERKLKDDIAKYGAIKPMERSGLRGYFFGELADGMKRFTSLDRDPTGASNMFFGGGAKALDDLSYGMTPMQQMPGRIPAIPTNEAMMNFLELVGL